jgi:hypothetical protein
LFEQTYHQIGSVQNGYLQINFMLYENPVIMAGHPLPIGKKQDRLPKAKQNLQESVMKDLLFTDFC